MKRTDRLIRRCRSWDEFYKNNAALPENSTEQGDNFERVVQLYLRTNPVFANNNFADVWHWSEVPSDVRKYINLPPRDEGADLVARDVRGQYYLIQAKFRSGVNALVLPDV